MENNRTVAIYFVASPLQYLAAKRIAEHFESSAYQVLVWYKPGMKDVVKPEEWEKCTYMPWPRLEPLPGLFGSHRRLRENIRLVAGLIGQCNTLVLHSAVFDTEAINYFLSALPKACGAQTTHARILPDGLISIRRYPLTVAKRLIQCTRKLRTLFAPELHYRCFSGDRIGSDADFCDRIYVVPGLPHEYHTGKVCVLPPLVGSASGPASSEGGNRSKRALVIGQPLVSAGLMSQHDQECVTAKVRKWLTQEGITEIDYKAHPKDPNHELRHPDYRLIEPTSPLESYMTEMPYDAVVGVRSSALMFARQIYPQQVKVVAFGWEQVNFKSNEEQDAMRKAFSACGMRFE